MQHRITSLDLNPFYRNSVGIDRLMCNMLDRVQHANSGNYPPYNIIQLSNDRYRIEVAVAGFAEDEIKVTADNGQLIILGGTNKCDCNENEGCSDCDETKYVHRGISSKSFDRTFQLAEHVEVQGASVINGILKIDLERIVPDNLKPKQIEVKFS
jgi:molecular chaperone IbpA